VESREHAFAGARGHRTPDIVVIGASAGGVEALKSLFHTLPADVDAAVFVVLHVSPLGASVLPAILSRASELPAEHARDGARFEAGRVYVAPPDHHLTLVDGRVRVTRGPRVNNHRPAIDPLFLSAASAYDSRVIGVVLSGALDDGTAGLQAIKLAGGVAIAQAPEEALYPSTPLSAVERVDPQFVRRVADIGPLLVELISDGVGTHHPEPEAQNVDTEANVADDFVDVTANEMNGKLVSVACPECNGAIWKATQNGVTQLACHVGHRPPSSGAFAPTRCSASISSTWTSACRSRRLPPRFAPPWPTARTRPSSRSTPSTGAAGNFGSP
jgi:two-component system, chemotaxis family, protein-glutamate methylesterase/glutaminase